VVAIIAILAAIAVPNFLEAQVRSKVSRVKADMRSTATSLEAYFVDNNSYPPDYSDVLRGRNPARYSTLLGRLTHLTTPIAYQTSVFQDVFADAVAAGSALRPGGGVCSPGPYRVGGSPTGALLLPLAYDYAKFDRTGAGADSVSVWAEITQSPESVAWALNSPGPDTKVHEYLGFSGLVIYDPTNGTISTGQILRTNLGADDKPKL
jgi:Tfp pilus assembly protein PilE